MSRKMLINASEPEETRVAIVEGSILEEYYVERMSVQSCLGNIYKGRVTNVEPSIGAAFIEFGGPRHGFLHVSDVMDGSVFDRDDVDLADEAGEARSERAPGNGGNGGHGEAGADSDSEGADEHHDNGNGNGDGAPGTASATAAPAAARARTGGREGDPRERDKKKVKPIQEYLKKGQEVIVQVTKDGIGTKGPTLTTYLSLPGRYLVLMPGLDRRGVSRKIDDGRERERLKKVLAQLEVRKGLGFIVRTAGIGQTKAALQKDYRYLTKLWDRVEKNAEKSGVASTLYRESDLVIRTIRDIYTPDMGDIIIDDDDCARRAREFLGMVMPKAVPHVKLYEGERPLFTAYGIEDEIGKLFMHRVELPSGGSLVIEQTEALVAIDVNSGRFRDEEDLEETAFKINLEAVEAIARQLRLRDLGGVIVVDFIDMKAEKRRRGIEKAFRNALKSDRARIKIARISPFGVIEMTRQRVRASLRQSIFKRCSTCRGAGYVATQETFELNLVRQLKLILARKNSGVEVYVNQENAEYLMNEKRQALLGLEEVNKKQVVLKVEAELRGDEFRIAPFDR